MDCGVSISGVADLVPAVLRVATNPVSAALLPLTTTGGRVAAGSAGDGSAARSGAGWAATRRRVAHSRTAGGAGFTFGVPEVFRANIANYSQLQE